MNRSLTPGGVIRSNLGDYWFIVPFRYYELCKISRDEHNKNRQTDELTKPWNVAKNTTTHGFVNQPAEFGVMCRRSMSSLNLFEWHDLPLKSISIKSDSIELSVSPFNEQTQEYDNYRLKLLSFSSLELDIESVLDLNVLRNMEISSFKHTLIGTLLSGTISILPANSGFWTMSFKDAQWILEVDT